MNRYVKIIIESWLMQGVQVILARFARISYKSLSGMNYGPPCREIKGLLRMHSNFLFYLGDYVSE